MVKGMQQTDIGLIPEDWEVVMIGEIANVVVGGDVDLNTFSEVQDSEYTYPIYSNTVTNYGLYGYSSDYKSNAYAVTIVGRGIGIGKAFKRNGRFTAIGRLIVVELSKNIVNNTFLENYINSYLEIYDESGGIPQLTGIALAKYQIPLPPLPEQEAIANALSDADAWIESLEQLIAKKRLIKKGAMQKLLTPKDDWEVKTLGEVGEVRMCKRVFQYQTSEYGEIPFYKIGTFGKTPDAFITRKHYEDFKSRFFYPNKGNILISAAGTIGKTVVYDGEESYFQDSNIVWIENQEKIVTDAFLKYVLDVIKYNTEGGTIQRLYNSILRSTMFHCPPLSEQTRIATILSDMDTEIEALEAQLDKARQIKQGMMQELLTGRIRLL
ncbi:restriction endonuclease subunit S [Sphingobacterium faecale]|uniref:Restriction endonuclease subunit S n=1 Tax=Sphingobacterium faecale TaxID=2803775 RepID=A0ABS1R8S3_9SPHI|nr:restriction endonuclease subunit S [Sphingobacterium faecale]MBL1411088.1 restriction endonuclease subunit S [Sphingobacterium faecale]